MSSRKVLLRFVFPSICGALGTWQVFRRQQKLELLSALEHQNSSSPKPIQSASEIDSDTQKYQLNGLSSTGRQFLLGPRGNSSIPGGYAFLLFESAKLPNGENVILNRGWVPRGKESLNTPLEKDSVVVVRDTEERPPLFSRKNSDAHGPILWKDWSVLARVFNLASPSFLKVIHDEDQISSNKSLIPHTLSTQSIPNRHVEYILTWYSLAAFSLFMSFLKK